MASSSSPIPQASTTPALKPLHHRLLIENPRFCSSFTPTTELSSSSLLRLSTRLEFYALLWGWMVVIGGFGPKLSLLDFWMVVILVFLGQLRNPSALGISILVPYVDVTKPSENSNVPMSKLELIWQATQLSVVLPSLVWSALRCRAGEFREVNNMGASLLLFFSILVCGSCAAMASVWFDFWLQKLKQGAPKIRPWGFQYVALDRASAGDAEAGAMAEHAAKIQHTESSLKQIPV